MQLVEAKESDSGRLKSFAQKISIPGRVGLRVDRHTDFFDIYRLQSDQFKTYFLEDENKEIQACATLVFRDGYINGELHKIGFNNDLWISNHRKALIEWPQNFLTAIKTECENQNCNYLFSAISDVERKAFSSFIRPKAIRGAIPRYFPLRNFHVIAIHGKLPFLNSPLDTIVIESGQESNLEELAEYLDRKSKERLLGANFSDIDKFYRQIQAWPGMSFSNFIIARDSKGKIIGCCAPWNPGQIETTIALSYGAIATTFRKFLSIASISGITRRLARTGHPLELSFLTHLFADNPDIFNSLIESAWQRTDDNQTLVYPHFDGHYATLPHPTFVHSKTPYALYSILTPEDKLPEFVRPNLQNPPPYFELVL